MKKLLSIFCAFLSVTIINCNSSSSSSSDLTSDQINAISKAMVTAMGATDYSASPSSIATELASAELASVDVDSMTFTHSASYDRYTANANDVSPCTGGGHITYTGTLVIACTAGATYDHDTGYLTSCGTWHTSIDFTFEFGDRTNNLNDCDVGGGLILDGTVYFTGSGNDAKLSMNLDGTLSLNTRGDTGGLKPYCESVICSDCSIFVSFPYGGTASGTICGYTVSSATTASLAEF